MWLDTLNEAVNISALMLCTLSIVIVMPLGKLDRRSRHYFLLYYICVMLFVGCNLAGQLLRGRTQEGIRFWLVLANYGEFLFAGLLASICSQYLLALGDPERRMKGARLGFFLLMLLHVSLVTVSQFTGLLYTIDDANVYHRSALYPLAMAAPGLTLAASAVLLSRIRERLPRLQQTAFVLYLTLPLIALCAQPFVYGIYLIVQANVLSVLAMCVFLITDQTERYYRKEQEAERLKVSLMLSQIQPHFLYNTLGSVQALCRRDPEAAEQALGEFSHFLRHNIQSLSTDRPILFRQELSHAQNYLALQKLRFGEDLNIVYDLQCETFSLPALTLQPLVENAVTHGIRQTETGRGTVTIRSRELEDRYEISVIDDGVGFDPGSAASSTGSHIALSNIRLRLSRVSGGDLRIESAPGKGTNASILIPKKASVHP